MSFALSPVDRGVGPEDVADEDWVGEVDEGGVFLDADEEDVRISINCGDDYGSVIGRRGETLDAIQYLVNLSSLRKPKSKDGDYV